MCVFVVLWSTSVGCHSSCTNSKTSNDDNDGDDDGDMKKIRTFLWIHRVIFTSDFSCRANRIYFAVPPT